MFKTRALGIIATAAALSAATASAADWGLKEGSPQLQSAGSLAFGPDGVLFVGDAQAATIFAIATGETTGSAAKTKIDVEGLDAKVAQLLGGDAKSVEIVDLAVAPQTGNVYLSVLRTQATTKTPALVRIDGTGKLTAVSLEKVPFSKIVLPNAPEDKVVTTGTRKTNRRLESITDLAFLDGKVLVSGLSSAEAPSTVREISFPFVEADPGTSLEIYHGAHGKVENYAPVRAFVPFNIGGQPNLLAGFTCTPLVKFPLDGLETGKTARGTTVAELGNRNKPLDMIVYEKDGKHFILMANSARGVMKISTENLDKAEGISTRIDGTAGLSYDTIADLKGVVQLDKLNAAHAVILVQTESGQNLRTVPLP